MANRFIKAMALLAAAVVLCASLFGCASATVDGGKATTGATQGNTVAPTQEPPAAEKIEGTVKIVFPGDEPKDMAGVKAALEEKLKADGLDLKLEFTYFPWDQYDNKVNLIPASGEKYDLLWTFISSISSMVAKKGLMPLDEYLDQYAPVLLKNIPVDTWKDCTIAGKIYGIPTIVPMADHNRFTAIRGDLRKKYGIPEINTIADFENYMVTLKQNIPDITYLPDDRMIFREYGDIVMPIQNGARGLAYLDPADPNMKVMSYYESDIFKNMVNLKKKWFDMGLLPKPNQIKDQEVSFSSGQIGAIWSVVLKTTERIDAFKTACPDGEIEDVFLYRDKPRYKYETTSSMLSLFSTSESPKQSIAFVNWFRSNQDNYDIMSYGVKDVNYKLDGDAVSYDGIASDKVYTQIFWAWDDINFKRFSKWISADYIDYLKNWDKDAISVPSLGFKFDSASVKTEIAQIQALEEEYAVPAINGYIAYDDFYDEFIKKLKAAGLDKVLAEMQTQIDAFKAAK